MQLTIQAPSILIYAKSVDFRKAINGLLDIVLLDLNVEPRENAFIFYNKKRDKLKLENKSAFIQNSFKYSFDS